MIKHLLEITDEAVQGNKDPLEVYVELKKIEKTLEACLEAVKPDAIREADRFAEKSFEKFGVKISKTRAPGRWDFKGVAQWIKQQAELKKIEELAKSAHKMAENGHTITDGDGVIIEPGKYNEGADIIKIEIPK